MDLSLKSDDDLMTEINKHFQKYLSNPENIESSARTLLEDLIEDAVMNVIFDVDIERKTGMQDILRGEPEDEKYQIVTSADLDIFGQTPGKKSHECVCPSCKRSLVASRFAPHLEKCMGLGRNSSRLASRRRANNVNKDLYTSGAMSDDNEDDADWTVGADKKGKKKKEKVSGKKLMSSKPPKTSRNGNSVNSDISDSSLPAVSLENLSESDRRTLLSQICGVISEHTKKICTRSTKCPQHTDEQKKIVRELFLPEQTELVYTVSMHINDF